MDLDELRSILSKSKVDVWSLIDSAITVASLDYGDELRDRRDGIVQKLYFPTASSSSSGQLCRNCHGDVRVIDENKQTRHQQQQQQQLRQDQDRNQNQKKNDNQVHRSSKSPLTPESNHNDYGMGNVDDVDDLDLNGGLFDDEQEKILHIRERLEDPEQDEESLVELLQTLVDMDITFKALQETDIGRVVSGFRKQHPSNEVRKLAKLLVRNWKETVDEWVRLNQPGQASVSLIGEESPQLNMQHKTQQNGHHQVITELMENMNVYWKFTYMEVITKASDMFFRVRTLGTLQTHKVRTVVDLLLLIK
ncbi:OLC1v1008855C2 [Oldenlandia corymbosa var. corymbosa]|uniref:OLC1v1008855C2 n=1 Tax=Oldenlandia corymbosa var. corymbosa TaxID=529605 RepID=A0AAV1DMG7_OLDCO|nr:OLC1v1008855C2 [Oldenlandia corymbosa var. corymbosa]